MESMGGVEKNEISMGLGAYLLGYLPGVGVMNGMGNDDDIG